MRDDTYIPILECLEPLSIDQQVGSKSPGAYATGQLNVQITGPSKQSNIHLNKGIKKHSYKQAKTSYLYIHGAGQAYTIPS